METSNTANTTEAKFQWRIRLGTVLGFPLYFHASFLLWFLLLLRVGVTNSILFVSLLVFSIALHELAHALVCRFLGFGDGTLTIWVFGGYFMPFSQMALFDMNRGQRFRYALMIVAGPVSNLLLAGFFMLLAYLTSMETLYIAASYNLTLAIVNLMPVGRLDGGGILTYLGSTIVHWRRATFFAGVLSLALAIFLFAAIFFDHWLGDYSSWGGFLIAMGISTIQASRKSEEEVRAESQKQVSEEIAFVESTSHTNNTLLAFPLIIGLASMLTFSVWHIGRSYFVYRDLPGRIIYVDRNYDDINLYITEGIGYPTTKASRSSIFPLPFPSSATKGNSIVFGCSSTQTSERMDLCIVDHQGSLLKEISLNNDESIRSLLLSPTGKKVAFSSSENEVLVLDMATEITTSFSVDGMLEAWSPDENYLLVSSEADGENEIFRINLQDHSVENLTNSPDYDYAPVFSQSGEMIYFMSNRYGQKVLCRMSADGLDFTRIGSVDSMYYKHADLRISSDNSKIVFECGEGFVCVANLDGSQSKLIAEGELPVWSPDGKYIAYFSRYDLSDPSSIYVIQSDGKQRFKIKSLDGTGTYLEWLP